MIQLVFCCWNGSISINLGSVSPLSLSSRRLSIWSIVKAKPEVSASDARDDTNGMKKTIICEKRLGRSKSFPADSCCGQRIYDMCIYLCWTSIELQSEVEMYTNIHMTTTDGHANRWSFPRDCHISSMRMCVCGFVAVWWKIYDDIISLLCYDDICLLLRHCLDIIFDPACGRVWNSISFIFRSVWSVFYLLTYEYNK